MSMKNSDAYDPQVTMEDLGQPTWAEAQADMYLMGDHLPRRREIRNFDSWMDNYTPEQIAEIEKAKPF